MPSKEDIDEVLRSLVSRISELKSTMSHAESSLLSAQITNITTEIEDLKVAAQKIQDTLTSHPEGVIYIIQKNKSDIANVRERVVEIEDAIDDLNDLEMKVSEIIRFKQNFLRVAWLIIGSSMALVIEVWFGDWIKRVIANMIG